MTVYPCSISKNLDKYYILHYSYVCHRFAADVRWNTHPFQVVRIINRLLFVFARESRVSNLDEQFFCFCHTLGWQGDKGR